MNFGIFSSSIVFVDFNAKEITWLITKNTDIFSYLKRFFQGLFLLYV